MYLKDIIRGGKGMTAYVFFMIFCSLIGVAVGAIAVFGIFAIRRAIRNKKQEKESEKK